MFGWLKDRFTNAGKLEKAARNATKAANKFGTSNTRNAARKAALDLEATAETTKKTIDMAQKELERVQKTCSTSINDAKTSLRAAQASHDKVKDTTFQRIKRFATLGRNAWGSRSAAVNVAQKRLGNAATKKREQLQALAVKQKAAMDAEEAALKKRKQIINNALGTAKAAATEAKSTVVPLLAIKNTSNNGANKYENVRGTYKPPSAAANSAAANSAAANSAAANSAPDPGTPGSTPKPSLFNSLNVKSGGRRRGGSRKPRRR